MAQGLLNLASMNSFTHAAFASLATLAFASSAAATEPEAPAPSPAPAAATTAPEVAPDAPSSPRWGLVGAGAGIFGGSYAAAVAFGLIAVERCGTSDGGSGGGSGPQCGDFRLPRLFIPIVGPFTYLGGDTATGGKVIFAVDGALQLAGAALAVVGAVWTKPTEKRAAASWTPVVGNQTVGIAGTF